MSFKEQFRNVLKDKFGIVSPSEEYEKRAMNSLYGSDIWDSIARSIKSQNLEEEKKMSEKKNVNAEEWIWVSGYKGTDRDMKCNGYQYELNKCHDMDCPDEEIITCSNGFHLCTALDSVFQYYPIGAGNRFFTVKALVRKSHYENVNRGWNNDKLVAKSIIFVDEISPDLVLKYYEGWDTDFDKLPMEYKKESIQIGLEGAIKKYHKAELIKYGYCECFATYLIDHTDKNVVEKAIALGSQEGLSMDVKVQLIFKK